MSLGVTDAANGAKITEAALEVSADAGANAEHDAAGGHSRQAADVAPTPPPGVRRRTERTKGRRSRAKRSSAKRKVAGSKTPVRRHSPFPISSFNEARELAEAIVAIAGGAREVRRVTLFDYLRRSPESGPSRQAIVNSSRYGLTEGGYQADILKLTEDGWAAVSTEVAPRERARARFRLAIERVASFHSLFERFKSNRLPAQQVMRDHLMADQKLTEEEATQAVELFIVNARDLGLLKTLSGVERIITLEHLLDELPSSGEGRRLPAPPLTGETGATQIATPQPPADLDHTCFYLTPIGEEGSDERKHADLILGQIVEPAIENLGIGLSVVRADKLTQPGMISMQILQNVLGAKLVVADLSYHNPNVFYELAIRHATGLPTVLISRASDRIPFDIADLRVVRVDMLDLYSFVPQMETWRAELTQHARQAIEQPRAAVTPITLIGGVQPLARRSDN